MLAAEWRQASVFNADTKTMQRMAPRLQRLLVVESNPAAARLLADLMKEMGTRQAVVTSRTDAALNKCEDFDPQLILIDFSGPDFDGLDFTRRLRRSAFSCRQAPVIMVTAEATAGAIVGARNAGVHEFLRKPYTAGDLFRRVENVTLKPRPWIEAVMYVGPDRRRFNSGEFAGSKKRRSDAFQAQVDSKAG
jgi:DNA-binding response OmpR family regulator